jgi:sugar transferase (PEP-CTERM/EpsH1 system associated)
MNLLYISHRIPYPPNKGEKIRAFHQIRHLARNNLIHLVCLVDDLADFAHAKVLEQWCTSVTAVYRSKTAALLLAVGAILTRKPLSVAAFKQKALAARIAERLRMEKFDAILVTSSGVAQYVLHVPTMPKVIDFIDVDSQKWRLYAQHRSFPLCSIYELEARRLARYEEQAAKVFDHSILCSEEERRIFQTRASSRPVSVISNGVDLEYFSPSEMSSADISQPTIIFTGVMDYFPNVDAVQYFCEEIFPLVRKSVPNARFYIVGRSPTRQVRRLGKQPSVEVTGTVSDVRPYLARATISVAPFRLARGVQNKVLEAMAMGVPVVGTAEAFKGIQATERDGIRVADDPESFAEHVISVLRDGALRSEAGLQARRYVERHHRWEDRGAELEQLLEEVVRKHRQKEQAKAEVKVEAEAQLRVTTKSATRRLTDQP